MPSVRISYRFDKKTIKKLNEIRLREGPELENSLEKIIKIEIEKIEKDYEKNKGTHRDSYLALRCLCVGLNIPREEHKKLRRFERHGLVKKSSSGKGLSWKLTKKGKRKIGVKI